MSHPPKKGQKIGVIIDRIGINGEGIGSWKGFTIFVPGALPGEHCAARITEVKKTFARANLIHYDTPAKERVTPKCPYYSTCGGCQMMHMNYETQLFHKKKRVEDALKKIGKSDITVAPGLPSPDIFHYRNKIQLHCREEKKGFLMLGTHTIVDIPSCLVHTPLGEKIYQEIRKIPLEPYIKHLIVRTGIHTEEVMLVFVGTQKPSEMDQKIADQLAEKCPELKSIMYNYNPTEKNTVLSGQFILLAGKTTIDEQLLGLRITLSAQSFFQVNPKQAANLYQFILDSAHFLEKETILDAYCGVGTLSLLIAQKVKKVIGVESVKQAIDNAQHNQTQNHIKNAEFHLGKVEEWLPKYLAPLDGIVLNPPRKGVEKQVIDAICDRKIKKIAYISCDPATLARDITLLQSGGYTLKSVTPFDLFPQTSHIETVALFSL